MFTLIRNGFHVAMLAYVIEGVKHGSALPALLVGAGYWAVNWREVRHWTWIARDRWEALLDRLYGL